MKSFIFDRCCKYTVILEVFFYHRSSEVVRGYDFLVNAIWPEIVTNIEARTHSIFAPGNPDVFHKVSNSSFIQCYVPYMWNSYNETHVSNYAVVVSNRLNMLEICM